MRFTPRSYRSRRSASRLVAPSAAGLAALMAALVACSSDDSGPPAAPGGGLPAPSDGVPGGPAGGQGMVPGGGTGSMSPGPEPGAGVDESPGNPGLNEGAGGSASVGMGNAAAGAMMGAGGALMPVDDFAAEPGPGFFRSGDWQGYSWTAVETDPVMGATVRVPEDFTTLPDGDPFCLTGTVAADPPSDPANTAGDGYQGFAMLGFNIAQAGVPEVEGTEPPVGTIVPTGDGIALTFSQQDGPLRLQIQGSNPALASQRFCAAVPAPDAQGRAFIPYSSITQECYLTPPGPSYEAAGRPPIEAVAFLVPGDVTPIPFSFCIDGFADGQSIADAPTSISGGGLISGTIGSKFGRRRVRGADGNLYVVQNNAWNPAAQEGNQGVSFEGNSFTVVRQANGGQQSVPISFPSIFVGGNGDQGVAGANSTAETDGLPVAINAIGSIQSTFNTNAGQVNGEYNATYDIWFANGAPQGFYDDAEAAFLMVWTHKPGSKSPIGINPFVTGVSIPGAPGTWDIWVGRRGENGAEANLNDNAPVISYTPSGGTINDFSANLLAFINDAVQRSNQGALGGFQFPGTLTLTDIFGGFEIWSGGAGLSVSEFSVDIQ